MKNLKSYLLINMLLVISFGIGAVGLGANAQVDEADSQSQSKAWLGMGIAKITSEQAETFGLRKPVGVRILNRVENGPPASEGFNELDLILEYGGQPIENIANRILLVNTSGSAENKNTKSFAKEAEKAPIPGDTNKLIRPSDHSLFKHGLQNGNKERIKELIVMVTAKLSEVNHLGSGIIFGMGSDRLYIVTANHVVRPQGKEAQEITIRFKWRPETEVRAELLTNYDHTLDLAVLRVSGLQDLGVQLNRLSFDQLGDPDMLHSGSAIYMLGHPGGRPWKINTTSEKMAEIRGDLLEFESTLIALGHSGGGLLNRTMELVGMLRRDSPPYGEAVHITTVLKKVAEWGYPVDLSRFSVHVDAGEERTCFVTANGLLRCWGQPREDFDRTIETQDLRFKTISVGGSHVCGITLGGIAYCMGNNHHGQLGNGSKNDAYSSPALVQGELVFTSISAGTGHTCGVTVDGQAYCWGMGKQGQLGHGKNMDSDVPVLVSGNLTFNSVSAGWLYSHGVTTNGTVYYWGNMNDTGFFGVSHLPILFTEGFQSVSAGNGHACGISTKGGAYCWGINESGDFGNGSARGSSLEPIQVSGGLTFKSLSVGWGHTCGLDSEGMIYCWGGNRFGQLGNASKLDSIVPIPIFQELPFKSISAGAFHTCGVAINNSIFCWGSNRVGELGRVKGESDIPRLVVHTPSKESHSQGNIHVAASDGQLKLLRSLLEAGTEIDIRDDFQRTPLHRALEAGNFEATTLLLDQGANPNARIPLEGDNFLPIDSPLTISLAQKRLDLVKLLLSKGGDPNAPSPGDGSTALHWAAAKADAEAVETLIKAEANPNGLNDFLQTPLHCSVEREDSAVTLKLLEAGADPNAMNYQGDRPVHIAAKGGREDLVRLLIDKGARVNYRNRWNQNALHIADQKEFYSIVNLLKKHGANAKLSERDEPTSLYLAARDGDVSRVKELLQKGADVHEQVTDSFGDLGQRFLGGGPRAYRRLPLHTAIINKHQEVVMTLLDAGADPNRWDAQGFSPFHLAVLTTQLDLAKLLLHHGAKVNWPLESYSPTPLLHEVIAEGNLHTVTFLLDNGAQVNATKNPGGETGLHVACRSNNIDMVTLLLSHGADPNGGTASWSPLVVAVGKDNVKITTLLLDAGAKIDAPTRIGGSTPLYEALKRVVPSLKVAALLIERGADVTFKNDDGQTPLDVVGLPSEMRREGLSRYLKAQENSGPGVWLGIRVQVLDSAQAAELGAPELRGLEVKETAPGSPGRLAEIGTGDVIVAYDNQPVRTSGELLLLLMESQPGQRVILTIFREGQRLQVPVVLKNKLDE